MQIRRESGRVSRSRWPLERRLCCPKCAPRITRSARSRTEERLRKGSRRDRVQARREREKESGVFPGGPRHPRSVTVIGFCLLRSMLVAVLGTPLRDVKNPFDRVRNNSHARSSIVRHREASRDWPERSASTTSRRPTRSAPKTNQKTREVALGRRQATSVKRRATGVSGGSHWARDLLTEREPRASASEPRFIGLSA